MFEDLPDEKAVLVEAEARRRWDYVENAYNDVRREWNNTLQWLFAVIAGGVGLAATMFEKEMWAMGVGLLAAAGWCSYVAFEMLRKGKAESMYPPGYNVSEIGKDYLDENIGKLRWVLARGLDARAIYNNEIVTKLSTLVDRSRFLFSLVPAITVSVAVAAWLILLFIRAVTASC